MARYIDADIAMAYFDRFEKYNGECYFDSVGEAVTEFEEIIDDVPTADVAPVVHGHWCKELVPFRDKLGNQHFGSCCSKCGGIFDRTKFCGGCGAKMDEEV